MPSPEIVPGVVENPEADGGPTAHHDLEANEVRRLALKGFGALLLRSVGQRGLQMAGNIALFRWLAPETHGFYLIMSFIVGIAAFLSDLGMGASLIQRRERLTEKDLRAAFTLSFGLNFLVTGTIIILAPTLLGLYSDLSEVDPRAIGVLALTVLAGSFTVIPSIRLERNLKFTQLSLAELLGSVAYVGVAIPLAFQYKDPNVAEAGRAAAVWVFIWATLASRTVYIVLVNFISPWRPRFGFDLASIRALLSFGLPFQATAFVNAAKDNFIPTFIAFAVGAKAVGYVTWAVGLVTNAIVLLPIVSKVTFPAYSRLQHDREALVEAVEKSIKWVAATVFPATLFLVVLAKQIVEHVYGPKWAPGLPSFYLLAIPMLNAAYSTVIVSALYGLGQARTVLRLTLIWAAAGWAIGVPFTLWFGMHGFAAAMAIVSSLSVLSVIELNKIVKVCFVKQLVRIFLMAGAPAGVVAYFAHLVGDAFELALLGLAGGGAYLLLMHLAGETDELREMIRRRRAGRMHPAEATTTPAEAAAEAQPEVTE